MSFLTKIKLADSITALWSGECSASRVSDSESYNDKREAQGTRDTRRSAEMPEGRSEFISQTGIFVRLTSPLYGTIRFQQV